MEYWEFVFGRELAEMDPDIARIIGLEEERQARRIILIPSESFAPRAVREALGSVFNNVYAEGYPPLRMTRDQEELLLDFAHQLAYYRRYADRRFYKGVEYVHFLETLAQRRCAELFANERVPADHIFVNVQPLSGAAANLAVYEAFLTPGDTIMGMDLFQGGHLTHGSEFNISGRRYKVVSYGVDPSTERLDYEAIRRLALEHRPRLIVAGYTSYPWAPDWEAFRRIADEVGALLMADIAHTAGMVAAGVHPSPVGIADVITFTTHKTICGPRGAVIMTTDEEKAQLIDAAVFPGEQGGPHTQKFAAMAVAFHIARTEPFRRLQQRIVRNARALAQALRKRGLKLAYGGTDTHIVMVDLRPLKGETGYPLKGEIAARILDLAGIVVNKNTIPGDEITALASGIRLGTPWVSQRGMGEEEMDEIADIMHLVLTNIRPFHYVGLRGELPRGKIELEVLERAKRRVEALVAQTHAETRSRGTGYPHYFILPERPSIKSPLFAPSVNDPAEALEAAQDSALLLDLSDHGLLLIRGPRAKPFVNQICTADIAALAPGQSTRSFILDKDGRLLDDVLVFRLPPNEWGHDRYLMLTNPQNTERVKAWLRGLSDGYIVFDPDDIYAKVEGPAVVEDMSEGPERRLALALQGPKAREMLHRLYPQPNAQVLVIPDGEGRFELVLPAEEASRAWEALQREGAVPAGPQVREALRRKANFPSYQGHSRPDALSLYQAGHQDLFRLSKPYFVGQKALDEVRPTVYKEEFRWEERQGELKRTPLYEEHKKLGAKMVPFAGWEMPVWYSSVSEEHRAVRRAAGLFDVAHMGVFEIAGEHAAGFLDTVASNYVRWLEDGQSCYSYLLDPDGNVIDDVMIYRRRKDLYLMVVNAVNEDKDFAWLKAVNEGRVLIDRERPDKEPEGRAILRNLKDPASGPLRRVDMALQGPASLAILQSLADDEALKDRLARLRRTELIEAQLAGMELIIARTGYTGEEMGFELFVHPDQAPRLWNLLLEKGQPWGIRPAGLGARDSTRTEAGLPLYGHELAGPLNIDPIEAGFAPYVKFHKPFFVGRKALLARMATRKREIVRFRMCEKGVRLPKGGDPVLNERGQYIGAVTSCAIDTEGYLLGMALVDRRYAVEGTRIGIIPSPPGGRFPPPKSVKELGPGDRVLYPVWAVVLPRFPTDEEKMRWSGGVPTPGLRFVTGGAE